MDPLTTALMARLIEEASAAEQMDMDERHDGDFTVCTLATLRSVVGAARGAADLKAVPVGVVVDAAATGAVMVRVVCDDPGFLFAWLPGDHEAVSKAEKASFLKATEGVDYADMSGCAGLCCANEPPKGGTKGTRKLLVMLPPGADAPSSGPAEFGQLGIARVEPLRAMRATGEKGRVHHAIGGGYTDKPVSEMS